MDNQRSDRVLSFRKDLEGRYRIFVSTHFGGPSHRWYYHIFSFYKLCNLYVTQYICYISLKNYDITA